jgi:hypothetical protein
MKQWRDDVDRLLGMAHSASTRLRPRSSRRQHEASASVRSPYRCTFVLCLIGRPKAHNFWHDPYLARPNLIVGLGRHGPHCGPCLGLKSSPRAGLARPI